MRKLITLATTAAIAINAVSPAFATSLPSWEEVIAKAANNQGGWVRGKHTDAVFKPLVGADGFLFGNVLADDTPLPRVTDVTKVLQAAKQGEKPIIVASQEWLLPSNPMLCEIARQVKMDCAEFTRLFYMHMQKNDDGTYVGDDKAYEGLHEIQAELISTLDALNVDIESPHDDTVERLQAMIESLEADAEANAIVIEGLNKTIADLKAAAEIDEDTIAKLNADLTTALANIQMIKAANADAIEAKDKEIAEWKAKDGVSITTIAALEADKAKLQTEINTLVGKRDEALTQAAQYKEWWLARKASDIANAALAEEYHGYWQSWKKKAGELQTQVDELAAFRTSINNAIEALELDDMDAVVAHIEALNTQIETMFTAAQLNAAVEAGKETVFQAVKASFVGHGFSASDVDITTVANIVSEVQAYANSRFDAGKASVDFDSWEKTAEGYAKKVILSNGKSLVVNAQWAYEAGEASVTLSDFTQEAIDAAATPVTLADFTQEEIDAAATEVTLADFSQAEIDAAATEVTLADFSQAEIDAAATEVTDQSFSFNTLTEEMTFTLTNGHTWSIGAGKNFTAMKDLFKSQGAAEVKDKSFYYNADTDTMHFTLTTDYSWSINSGKNFAKMKSDFQSEVTGTQADITANGNYTITLSNGNTIEFEVNVPQTVAAISTELNDIIATDTIVEEGDVMTVSVLTENYSDKKIVKDQDDQIWVQVWDGHWVQDGDYTDTNGVIDGGAYAAQTVNTLKAGPVSGFIWNAFSQTEITSIKAELEVAFEDGYDQGYADGYQDGWNDAIKANE